MTYRVRPWLVALLAAAALGGTALVATTDGPGRLLFAVAAAGAACEAVRGALPTVVADGDAVEVLVGLRRERHPWSAVAAIGQLAPPAAGARPRRRANALELDLGDRLLVVPAYRLGAPVGDVVTALSALSSWKNPAGGGGGF